MSGGRSPRLWALSHKVAPATDTIVRVKSRLGAQQTNIVIPRQKEAASIACEIPPEGVPLTFYGAGIPNTTAHPTPPACS